jgi:hypothetical protein
MFFWLLLGTLVSMDFLSETSRAMHTTHPQVVISVCRLAARDRLFPFISVQMTSNKKAKCASNCIYLPESFVAVRRRRRRFQQQLVVDVLVGCVLFSRVFAFPFRRFVLPRFSQPSC